MAEGEVSGIRRSHHVVFRPQHRSEYDLGSAEATRPPVPDEENVRGGTGRDRDDLFLTLFLGARLREDNPGVAPATDDSAARFRARLLRWYASGGRDFPWRHADGPFHLLLAELMLRRTQAIQVAPVYELVIARFPTPAALAAAPEDTVADLLRPLGLAWRVPAFRQLAAALVERHAGRVPVDRAALLGLPGVGEYVASAVRAVAFGVHDPIYDTNTVRVAGRYFGFPTHAESRRRRPVQRSVDRLFDPDHPRRVTLAFLDFAALVCRATRPQCGSCPMLVDCSYGSARADGDALLTS